ncbi:ABC transporter permease [Lacticigenium naphthae]|uniref:ABC transporter permease n=1 Tax=Lacticigenium naphthae TaxID=515351 RepID=UPI00041A5DAE|nr:ABC transporter permease [Lacticigenium naphthae]
MFNLIKKDFAILSKTKSDLLELLFMPFILLIILGFSLGNVFMSEFSIDTFKVGLVNEQTTAKSLDRFEADLQEDGLPAPAIAELLTAAEESDPEKALTRLLQDESLEELMETQNFDSEKAAEEAIASEEIRSYIRIPENFSYNAWKSLYLNEENGAELILNTQSDGITGNILQSVVNSFIGQYNVESSIAIATQGEAEVSTDSSEYGEVVQLSVEEPINAFQYYTIGMGVMFALFTAPSLATRAFKEKEQHVFGRMMLSGMRPLTYLVSKFISGTSITFVQLITLFTLSTVVFGTFADKELGFWIALLTLTASYALFVGSLTSILTSVSLYSNNSSTVGFFGSFVSVFAFLGGSFTPVDQFSEALKKVGNWTPNGAAMTSYLQLLQGFSLQEVFPLMSRIITLTVIALVVSVWIFPKRRLE